MKKILLLTSVIVNITTGFAQLDTIKNPNFDNWSSATTTTGWTTVNASQATGIDIYSGANTLVLSTTTGPTVGTATAAAHYRIRPVSVTYFSKYVNGGGDAPMVQVTLTKKVGAQIVVIGSGSSISAGASYAQQTININYVAKYHAYAPDTVKISIASSGSSPAVGSMLYIDNIVFVNNCNLDPNIVTSGTAPLNLPTDGDTIHGAVAGQPFNFHMTNFVPKTVDMNLPFGTINFPIHDTVDSVKTSSYQLSGSASNFMTVDTSISNRNFAGGNSISCLAFSGTIPASPANAVYILIVTPLVWGNSSVAPLNNFPSPITITFYIKVGTGGDTITSTDNIYWGSMMSGGVNRLYSVYVPAKYKTAHVRVPLLFNIHGWTGSPTKQLDFENFRPVADTANFIIVTPLATGKVPSWISGAGNTDTDFLFALMNTIEAKYQIDTDRVYCTGFSEGGMMCYTFACYYSNRIAAVASVAGGLSSTTTCAPIHYMPVMETHGTNDPLANYSSVKALLNYWVGKNKIDTIANPVVRTMLPDVTTADNSTVQHWVYNNPKVCGATIEHYKVLNGGHECPTLNPNAKNNYGLNARNNDYEAVVAMWRFLSKYRLSELCSLTTDIEESANENNYTSIFPNPSNGTFTLEVQQFQNTKVKITDVLGKIVFETALKTQLTTIDLGTISEGVYIYQITGNNSIFKNGKLIIQ